jgi:protein phosphatase
LHELAEIHDYPPRPGDRLILTSDGVSNFIPDADYAATIAKYPNPQAAAEAFTQLALDRGTKDNVTCLVIAFD